MSYSPASKAGLGDPYWYEWTVGLHYAVEMLNPDTDIDYIEFQADVALGIDDVLVTHKDGSTTFYLLTSRKIPTQSKVLPC